MRTCALGLAAVAGLTVPALAQVQVRYAQSFDNVGTQTSTGPANLVAQGWVFRNQSANRTATMWRAGNYISDSVVPNSGGGFIAANANWNNGTRIISSWMILPPVPGQQAGDVVSYVINGWAYDDNHIELRYSPTGGTSTGSTYSDVGDFTQVLADTPLTPNTWQAVWGTLPGDGRIAIRWVNPLVTQYQSPSVMVDTLTVSDTSVDPPIPQPGETVAWTLAMSPVTIRSNTTIPAGGTVNVEPGVTVRVAQEATLFVSGTLNLAGTAGQRIMVEATAVYPPAVEVVGGTLDAGFTDFRGQLRPSAGGQVRIADSTFSGHGLIYSALYMGTGYAEIARTTFTGSELTISNYTVVLKDVTLASTFARLVRCYPFMDGVSVSGKSFDLDASLQGTFLHDITVTDSTQSYGLGLGGNFLIDSSVTLAGNRYPLHLSGGILPGSVLPPTGNVNNRVFVEGGDQSGEAVWAHAGLPYYVASARVQFGGALKVLPGVEVLMDPSAGMINQVGDTRVLGTPEAPVTFRESLPGGRWYPLQNFDRFRHTVLDGASTGAAWPSHLGWGFMDGCVVRNCSEFGVRGQAVVRATQFMDNAVGAYVSMTTDLLGETNPNSFEGNGVGVADASDARFNWWGSPGGPQGGGDAVASGVPFEPFLTERPDYTDYAPVVDLEEHSFMARPGEKMVLTWRARDNGSIVRQRVLLSLDGDIIQGNLIEPVVVLADNLEGDVRSIEFVVPAPGTRFFGSGQVRVESIDDAGQVGWDQFHLYLERDEASELVQTTVIPAEVRAGDLIGEVCFTRQGQPWPSGSINAYLHLENTDQWISLGGVTTNLGCLPLDLYAPFISTDRARLVFSLFTGGGVSQPEYYYQQHFAVRPDARVGDGAPAVVLTSPSSGESFAGGTVVPVRWSASDDQGVRAVHVQASTDGGRTWSFIAKDLAGSAPGFDWALPDSTGIADVRVKVVAVDLNFQDTSAQAQFVVTPGSRVVGCHSDFDGDGDSGTDADIEAFFACIAGNCCPACLSADFDGDGDTATDADIEAFFRVLAGGSC